MNAPWRICGIALLPLLPATLTGCIILPNPAPIKKPGTIHKVEVGTSTHEDVLRILGKPQVVETPYLQVYAWERPAAFFAVGGYYTGYVGPLGIKATRAIVELDANGVVTRLESSWDETEPELPELSCERQLPACGQVKSFAGIGVTAMGFTPVGDRLAILTSSGKVKSCIQDSVVGDVRARLTCQPRHCGALSFSADGSRLAAVGGKENRVVWDLEEGAELLRDGPKGMKSLAVCAGSIALSPDGALVASLEPDEGLMVRNVDDGEIILEIRMEPLAHGPVFSPDGALLSVQCGPGGLAILDVDTGDILASRLTESKAKWQARSLAFSPDGRYLAAASCVHVEIHRVDRLLETGNFRKPEAVMLLPIPKSASLPCRPGATFSRDGSQLAVITAGTLTRFEVPSGELLAGVRFPGLPTVVAVDPEFEHLVLALATRLRMCDLKEPPDPEP